MIICDWSQLQGRDCDCLSDRLTAGAYTVEWRGDLAASLCGFVCVCVRVGWGREKAVSSLRHPHVLFEY